MFVCVDVFAESTAMCSCVRSSRALSPALLPRLLLPQTVCRSSGRALWTSPNSMAVSGDSQLLSLPSQARVVICGGGVVGTSVAYHLAKLGWTDIVLLEQGRWVKHLYSFMLWEYFKKQLCVSQMQHDASCLHCLFERVLPTMISYFFFLHQEQMEN